MPPETSLWRLRLQISLDEMITGAKTLIFSQELDCFRTQAPGARLVVQKLFHHLYTGLISFWYVLYVILYHFISFQKTCSKC